MGSSKITRATEFQEANRIPRDMRPVYHVTPPTGWMNDPNGFSVYKDQIHLFYQYHPYKDIWGPMHWGHCISQDFLTWTDLPVALAPDEVYDESGCFSGSALTQNGEHVLIYTGAGKRMRGAAVSAAAQQQCVARGDGVDYVKDEDNPVIRTAQLPPHYLANDFRDPKVWQRDDGTYWLVAAARQETDQGSVLAYTSEDLRTWEFRSVIRSNDGKYGDMWECPDLFVLDGSDILLVSAMHMKNTDPGFHDGFGVIACVGVMDWNSGELKVSSVQPVDQGADFYAPQTLVTPDGRRIMIAWMQAWENIIKPADQKWQGMMTFPRELSMRNGRIVQRPVRELALAHVRPVHIANVEVAGQSPVELPAVRGRVMDLTVRITEAHCSAFSIEFAVSAESGIRFTWTPEKNAIHVQRKLWGAMSERVTDRFAEQTIVLPQDVPCPSMRFLVDTASVELFVEDGAVAFSSTYYAPPEADSIQFSCSGTVTLDIQKYDIDPAAAAHAAEQERKDP